MTVEVYMAVTVQSTVFWVVTLCIGHLDVKLCVVVVPYKGFVFQI